MFRNPHFIRQLLIYVLLWGTLIGTLFYVLQDWPSSQQWQVILSGDRLLAIPLLFLCFVGATVLRGIRWGLLLKDYISFKWSELVVRFSWYFFLATFSPFRAGELARPLWVRKQGGSASMATGLLMVERLADVLVLLLCVGIVSVFSPTVPGWIVNVGTVYLFIISVAYLVVSIFAAPVNRYLNSRHTINEISHEKINKKANRRLYARLMKLMEGIAFLSDIRINIPLILITICIWLTVAYGFHVYLTAFFPELHWTAAFAVMGAVNLSSLVAIAPGNLGVYELVSVITLSVFSVSSSDALVASVGLHAVILVSTIICGLLAKLKLQQDGQRFRDMV